MSKLRVWVPFWPIALFLVALFLALGGCATHRSPSQSWDQANLKRNDFGCPTAIFVAPDGNLKQCETEHSQPAGAKPSLAFNTANEAAVYATQLIYSVTRWYEYGGVIARRPDGKFVVSRPRTQYHGEDVSFSEDPEDYQYPIVATYHVHPCIKTAIPSVFSPQDLAGSRSANRPAYVADFCTGAVHYWAPGDGYSTVDELFKLGITPIMLARGVQLASGRIVGWFKVTGEVIQ
jgi:hypothetical protein